VGSKSDAKIYRLFELPNLKKEIIFHCPRINDWHCAESSGRLRRDAHRRIAKPDGKKQTENQSRTDGPESSGGEDVAIKVFCWKAFSL
jgi:hypothetical protein